jgi:hypothetical protein
MFSNLCEDLFGISWLDMAYFMVDSFQSFVSTNSSSSHSGRLYDCSKERVIQHCLSKSYEQVWQYALIHVPMVCSSSYPMHTTEAKIERSFT